MSVLRWSLLVCSFSALACEHRAEDVPPLPLPSVDTKTASLQAPPKAAPPRIATAAPTDARALEAATSVRTDPGSLPRLQVDDGGKKVDLPLRHTQVGAELTGFVARVEITQTYENPHKKPIEAIYVFPLPENAAVDGMRIQIGARVIEAEIKKREDARADYEAAKKAGQTAALLEQERPNIFTQSIANIAPGETIDVVIRYVQDLTYDAGRYEFVFPMVVGPRFIPGAGTTEVADASRIVPPILGTGVRSGHDIDLDVVLETGSPVIDFEVPTHEVTAAEEDGVMSISLAKRDELPNRDFVLRWKVADKLVQGTVLAHKAERGGYFSLVLQPPKLDVDALVGNRELVFVMDISGSMWGQPIALAKAAMREAIARIRPSDTFNIVTFAGRTARAFDAPRPANLENIRRALQFIDKANAGGGTQMADAVEVALRPDVERGRHRYVFFFTDGFVGNEDRLLADTAKFVSGIEAGGQRARVFGFGVGSSVNRMLLDGFGKAGKGATVYVTNREEPAHAVNQFFRMIDHAVLTDLSLEWQGVTVKDVEPAVLPDLFASRPTVLHGRYDQGGSGRVIVRGKAGDQPVELVVPVVLASAEPRHAALETLWARARVAGLEQILWAGPDEEAKASITALGLEHRIVTAFTSFIAIDRSRIVGTGDPATIVQPVELPEAMAMHGATGLLGSGTGGGGAGFGQIAGFGRMDLGGSLGAVRFKEAKRPTARLDLGATKGTCDTSIVQSLLRRRASLIRACGASGATGKLRLRIVFGKDGRVKDVKLVLDTVKDKAVTSCIERVLRRLVAPPSAGECIVEQPMSLLP